MKREEVSRLLAEGQEFEGAGCFSEAKRIAIELLRAIYMARSKRRDGSDCVRESDVDAIAWAQSVIEKHRSLELLDALPLAETRAPLALSSEYLTKSI
jgi:hypothetical protein